jgi:hypothetical protein
MWPFGKRKKKPAVQAHPEALRRKAAQHPGGYLYHVDQRVADPMGEVPFFAIVGWFKVGDDGEIEGAFQDNEKYDRAATGEWVAARGRKPQVARRPSRDPDVTQPPQLLPF